MTQAKLSLKDGTTLDKLDPTSTIYGLQFTSGKARSREREVHKFHYLRSLQIFAYYAYCVCSMTCPILDPTLRRLSSLVPKCAQSHCFKGENMRKRKRARERERKRERERVKEKRREERERETEDLFRCVKNVRLHWPYLSKAGRGVDSLVIRAIHR